MATILVIDDEDVDRLIVAELLREEGHEVIEVQDGSEGIAVKDTATLNLIVTDIMMPEKDGIETIMEIKRDNPNLKIIAVSGGGKHGQLSGLEMAKYLGADDTLTKPISAEKLIGSVNKLLA
ncbi:MAG: response regulator [Alphaproteobacteria bacterium]|jgi:CheY-like chemotaxis protein|nr:response regulator [Rhodospirillaceae bacterium]MDP6403771.1 response regulator [Alphaproteobacteria bacterium]MDP6624221.1 response regulator [Alphaproteobacteria bacterium]|tara:strand:- start:3396 stop:3761 length:366 start_codon:yes stop_codon:yes gene_type:complete